MFGSRIYTPQTHDFFDEVTALIINLASFNAATESFWNANRTEIPNSPDHTLYLMGRIANASFPIHTLMHNVVRNVWPVSLEVGLHLASIKPPLIPNGVQLQSHGITNLVVQLVGTTFLKYYERNIPRVKKSFPTGPKTWPEIWRFAWLLRNAIAHGDKWSIDDIKFPHTQWHGINVASHDSGQPWFNVARYIGGGDVLFLMEELNVFEWSSEGVL